MKKIHLFLVLVAIGLIAANIVMITGNSESDAGINYNSMACISKNGEGLGCYHNVYTSCGKEQLKACLGQGTCAAANYIALCNNSGGGGATEEGDDDHCEASANWNNFTFEYVAGGLSRAAGTFSNNSDTNIPGNWSIWNTFTATVNNLVVNATALHNGSVDQANCTLAIVGFPNVTLQTNDQLTVNWTIFTT